MKSFFIVLFLFLNLFIFGQIEIRTNLPPRIAPNSNLSIEVKIKKGSINNFSKYQIDVPAGVSVSEGNSKTGNFSFEANRAKIVWVSIPAEPEFIISLNMNIGAMNGSAVFNQKFFYLEDGTKKDFEPDSVNVVFDAAGSTAAVAFQEPGNSGNNTVGSTTGTGTQSALSSSSSPPPTSGSGNTSSNTSGTSDNTLATNSNSTTSDNTSLSSKIDEHNNKHGAEKTEPVTKIKAKTSQKSESTIEHNTERPIRNSTNPSTETSSASGLVFRIQLGAYGSDPGKARFNKAGKVSILNEGGYYKVLCGSFNSKEDALIKLEELKGKGLEGFVVKYQDGVRAK